MAIRQTSNPSTQSPVSPSSIPKTSIPSFCRPANHHKDGAIGSSFTWTAPPVTTTGVYALSIRQSGAVNYSPQFTIYGTLQTTNSQVTITSFASTSTNIIASTTMTPSPVVAALLIPSNSTVLPSVTSEAPYPTVNQNSTYTALAGTVAPIAVSSYPSATGAGNVNATSSPSFAGSAGKAGGGMGMTVVVAVGALSWGLLMG